MNDNNYDMVYNIDIHIHIKIIDIKVLINEFLFITN